MIGTDHSLEMPIDILWRFVDMKNSLCNQIASASPRQFSLQARLSNLLTSIKYQLA